MNGPVEKLELIIKKLPDGALILDSEEKIVSVNPQAEEALGKTENDLLGKKFSEVIINLPNLNPVTNSFDFKKIWGIFKKEIFRDSVSGNVWEADTIPLKEGNDDFGKLIMFRDITREKNIEKVKDEFVSLAAHQLRTPLSAIKWTLSILLDERAGKLNDEQKTIVEKSYESNERMIHLIKDLLNVAKLEEGKYIFEMTMENIQDIVQDVIYELKEELDKKKIKFYFKKPLDILPKIKVDKEKIKLVIENLMENAIKYTPKSGEVTISLKSNKIDIEFKVQDSGIGVAEDQKPKIFTKFYRAGNAIQTDTDGSGLGLYLSKNIVEAHNGKIGFDSEENKGSSFWFTLPIKEEFEKVLERF